MMSEWQRSAQRVAGATDFNFKDIKVLLPLMNDVDIISFFASFERILQLNMADKSLLPSQLSAKALRAYSRLSLDETKSYKSVKKVILRSYNLDATSYLKHLHSCSLWKTISM